MGDKRKGIVGAVLALAMALVPGTAAAEGSPSPTATNVPEKPVGAQTFVWGRFPTEVEIDVLTQVRLPSGQWATSQTRRTDETGGYSIPLTYGSNVPGVTTWRVAGVMPDGDVLVTDEFTLTRVPSASATAATKKVVNVPGSVWGTFATDRPMQVWTEALTPRGWVRSQLGSTNASGGYSLPLTYRANVVGWTKWRVAGLYPNGHVTRSRTISVLRVPNASALKAHDVRVVGHSVQGRPIHAFQIGDPDASKKVLLLGSMHGDEPLGTRTIDAMMRDRRLVAGVDLWVIPTMNPDGLAVGRRTNAHGVDLNANFPLGWGYRPTKNRYWAGKSRASEPETQAMMRFLTWLKPDQFVSIHQPLFAVDSFRVKDKQLMENLSRELSIPIKYLSCRSGTCGGTMTYWHNETLPGAAITIEYRHTETARYVNVTARDGLLKAVGARWK